jgi:hypothetical protein
MESAGRPRQVSLHAESVAVEPSVISPMNKHSVLLIFASSSMPIENEVAVEYVHFPFFSAIYFGRDSNLSNGTRFQAGKDLTAIDVRGYTPFVPGVTITDPDCTM